MIKKLLAMIVLMAVASLSIAGCTSSTNSNQTGSSLITGGIKRSIYDSKDRKYHDVCFSNACAAILEGAVLL